MNVVDLFVILYVGLGFRRGRNRGASEELYRVVRTGIAFAGGVGLFSFVRALLVSALGLEGGMAGALGFLGSFAAVFAALRLLRVRIHSALKVKCSHLSALAGGVIGAVRAGINSLVVLFSAILSDLPALDQWVSGGSFVGKILHFAVSLFS